MGVWVSVQIIIKLPIDPSLSPAPTLLVRQVIRATTLSHCHYLHSLLNITFLEKRISERSRQKGRLNDISRMSN